MTKEDKATVLQSLTKMALALGQEPSVERQKIYLEHLSSLPLSAILAGVQKTIDTWVYNTYPPVGYIRNQAGGNQTLEQEAEAEWYQLRNYQGPLQCMAMDGPTIQVVAAMGGRGSGAWAFGKWPSDQEGWKKKEFIGRYVAMFTPSVPTAQIPHQEAQELIARIPGASSIG